MRLVRIGRIVVGVVVKFPCCRGCATLIALCSFGFFASRSDLIPVVKIKLNKTLSGESCRFFQESFNYVDDGIT